MLTAIIVRKQEYMYGKAGITRSKVAPGRHEPMALANDHNIHHLQFSRERERIHMFFL